VITVIIAFGVVFYFYSRSKKNNKGNWVQFLAKSKEAGFSIKESEMLFQLATQNNLENPCTMFESHNQFDYCLRALVKTINSAGSNADQGAHDFLSRLYDYRKRIENKKASSGNSIINTYQIKEGQFLKVLVAGTGVFQSQVVKNTNQYLVISRPANSKYTSTMSWFRTKISVYFWREDDAGYVFDSEVLDEVFSKGVPSLKIPHCESLFRTQQRKSKRVKINKTAYLYLVTDGEPSHKIESEPGIICFLEDISETGCAVTVGGKADSDMRVKVQFGIGNSPVCMAGTVRSTTFKEDKNRSVLRIEADVLPIKTRNVIPGEIYNTSADDDDELPFRVLDDEAANFADQNVSSGSAANVNIPAAGSGDSAFEDAFSETMSGKFIK